MKPILHTAHSRGYADHGWLQSRHTFSFADYYDPDRMGFGQLRVLNDDHVAPAMGFPTHPHQNMEIVSIPLSGSLAHKDSMGHVQQIHTGEVQVMSAGTGLTHSEYNASATDPVDFLQIWVIPHTQNLEPRYDQRRFDATERIDRWQPLVNPDGTGGALEINQQAWFSRADLHEGTRLDYRLNRAGNGVYFFVLSGSVAIDGQPLAARDGYGLVPSDSLSLQASSDTELLAIEVPMH